VGKGAFRAVPTINSDCWFDWWARRKCAFAHASVTGLDWSIPFCVVLSPDLASVRGQREAAT